jgi:hypothetical protein
MFTAVHHESSTLGGIDEKASTFVLIFAALLIKFVALWHIRV